MFIKTDVTADNLKEIVLCVKATMNIHLKQYLWLWPHSSSLQASMLPYACQLRQAMLTLFRSLVLCAIKVCANIY